MKAEQPKPNSTDWNAYYRAPYKTASVTRRITEARIIRAIRRYQPAVMKIVELGGANSCFFDAIMRAVHPSEYHVVDNNQIGLTKFRERIADRGLTGIQLHHEDVLNLKLKEIGGDLVFSAGLIEHFEVHGTRSAVQAHFELLRSGGIALITFPTPTFLYRFVRRCSEGLGLWIFHDERPLALAEVRDVMAEYGTILHEEIIWPICLTQGLIVAVKR